MIWPFRSPRSFLRCGSTTIALLALLTAELAAQPKPNQNSRAKEQERRDDARIREQREDLEKAEKGLKEDLAGLREAETSHKHKEQEYKKLALELGSVRKQVEEQFERSLGIPEALERQAAAQKNYDAAATLLREKLKGDEAFQTALKNAQQAREDLRALAEIKSLSATERKIEFDRLNAIALAAVTIEKNALESDKNLKLLHDKLSSEQEKTQALREKQRDNVEKHGDVKNAQRELEKARKAVDASEDKLKQLRAKVASDQQKIAAERTQLQKAIIDDKKNDGNNRANNGPKRKN